MNAEILLIVDDDPVIAEALAAALEKDGRTIILCGDVESAEIIVEHYPVTRILADVQMTGRRFGFEGLQLLDHFRQHAPQSPVVLMSGAANESMAEEAKSHGAVGLLSKPFEMSELEAMLLKDPS